MSLKGVIICDSCGQQHMLDDGMDIPPLWFGAQIVVADSEGLIPLHEREIFVHFCSQECLSVYAKGGELRERAALVEQEPDEESDIEEDGMEGGDVLE